MVGFGEKIKKLRMQAGMTQQQLANQLGITKSVVSYYELQERYPSPEILIKLAVTFHVTTDYLLGLESRNMLDVTGISDKDLAAVTAIIESLKLKNKE